MQTAVHAMHFTKTKHIFIAGSFISHPLTQRLVAEEFEHARWMGAMLFDGIVSIKFITQVHIYSGDMDSKMETPAPVELCRNRI